MPKANANLLADIRSLREEVAARDRRILELEAALSQASERETATSEILRVISSSPTDIQPVLDTMAESAARLCESLDADIFHLGGDRLRLVAHHGAIPTGPVGEFSLPLVRGTAGGRSVLDRRTIHVADMQTEADEFPESSENARRMGFRTILSVPLMREGVALGAIILRRTEAQPFAEQQGALLQTFADQAVIAIENVRLFTELQEKNRALTEAHAQVTEALERQTATSEILRVISRSPADVQPVFDTIARNASRLCDGMWTVVVRYDGELIHLVADENPRVDPKGHQLRFPAPATRHSLAARPILEETIVHITDVTRDPDLNQETMAALGLRGFLGVPMMRDGRPIGSINVSKAVAAPFTDRQIDLLKTFADQAVIAIENVRLFKELETRNRDLTTALDRQTATSEILKVISSSPTDVQPVFDAIARSASRLLGGAGTMLTHVRDGMLHRVAGHSERPLPREAVDEYLQTYPRPLDDPSPPPLVVRTGQPFISTDIRNDPRVADLRVAAAIRENAVALGYRSLVIMPMLREGQGVGAIHANRAESGSFSDAEIDLLKTFADQAVIAIENVRLFTELQEKNRALTQAHAQVTEALDQQTATSEILRVISRSPTDVQPVFEAIVESAARLCNASNSTVYRYDGQLVHLEALYALTSVVETTLRGQWPRPLGGESVVDLALRDARVIHFPDVESDPSVPPLSQRLARMIGFRSVLTVPMLRENRPIGCITVTRPEPSAFSDTQISLLQTFADQAVIAIENVQLFKELEARNRDLTVALDQQTATGEILRAISRAQTDVQPVFDVIASSALRLCDGVASFVFRHDGTLIHLAAFDSAEGVDLQPLRRIFPAPPEGVTFAGRVVTTARLLYIADIEYDREAPPTLVEFARANGFRSIFAAPMLRDGRAIGAIAVTHRDVDGFTPKQGALLETFADQAVIAIENVRLFKELQEKNRALTQAHAQVTEGSNNRPPRARSSV